MKFSILFVLTLTGFTLHAADDDFRALFNGKDLTGWNGNPDLWSVVDGAITGKTNGPEHLSYNQFLTWRGGTVKNFELKAKIKVTGNNTGIQYRSKELPENGKWSVGGYQCDVHPKPENNAMGYEERGRGIIANNGQSIVVDPQGTKWIVAERDAVKVDVAEWNEYTIIAKGNHLIHKLNGKVTIDLVDHEESARALEGLLAFQIHRGPAMVVQIKDVMLKELPDGGVISFAKSQIPNDAQIVEKPKAAPPAPAQAQARPKRERRRAEVGQAIGQNKATPVDRIKAAEGFAVELIYSVPGKEQGSWAALCSDPNGRMYACDQYGELYQFMPPAKGQTLSPDDVTKVPVDIRAINGMIFADGALYAGVNDYEKKIQSGLYRISDSNGDAELDKVELVRAFDSSGDHGVHAVVPTPDGKYFYLITGNNATISEGYVNGTPDSSPVAKVWGDDHLLPRMPDGRGHNRHVLAPGGVIYRVSRDGKEFEMFASGFRNIYGGSLNKDGELFTYDADMEYDFNTPWYRPTRVNHVVSGAEYGWRNGAGKYPEFYPDTLPATLNIGPGSPTGTRFGYGAKYPAKYQNAFYVLDWSWGKIYAVHLEEDGATYKATKEEFITGAPLPVTDAIIHPQDGAMYFAIGGRRVQSGLYRVTYTGTEDTAPVDMTPKVAPEHQLRHSLEAFHGKQDPRAVATAWPYLNHHDRTIRAAARVILEHQPTGKWERGLNDPYPGRRLPALLALARVTGVSPSQRPETGHVIDTESRDRILKALLELDFASLTKTDQLTYARTAQIVLIRFGDPDKETADALIAKLDAGFPADNFEVNWLLCENLAYLQAPNTAAKGMALIAAAESQEPQMEYARSLRFLKTGWTPELRRQQLEWF
ncbi:MAG: glucose/arabinose dehydrogenase, partial [Verrucomicrobiales bacterium]